MKSGAVEAKIRVTERGPKRGLLTGRLPLKHVGTLGPTVPKIDNLAVNAVIEVTRVLRHDFAAHTKGVAKRGVILSLTITSICLIES